jgi:hypothetical protein
MYGNGMVWAWESGQRIEELRMMPEGGVNPLADPDLPEGLAQRRQRQQKHVNTAAQVVVLLLIAGNRRIMAIAGAFAIWSNFTQ